MKQKLALCCALIHQPQVLFLDEPTTGVDPVSRHEFWEMLKKLKDKGITILVSTPYMDEASLCDRIALIQSGRIMRIDTLDNIVSAFPGSLYAVKSGNMIALNFDLKEFSGISSSYIFGEYIHISLKKDNDENMIKGFLKMKGHSDIEISKLQPGIEDCFMDLMNNPENR